MMPDGTHEGIYGKTTSEYLAELREMATIRSKDRKLPAIWYEVKEQVRRASYIPAPTTAGTEASPKGVASSKLGECGMPILGGESGSSGAVGNTTAGTTRNGECLYDPAPMGSPGRPPTPTAPPEPPRIDGEGLPPHEGRETP